MAGTFAFYKDSGLTQVYAPGDTLGPVTAMPTDYIVYLGSVDSAVKLQSKSNAGVDPVQVSLADAAPGGGVETTDAILSVDAGGLDTNTPGATLDLQPTINGGAGNRVEIFVRVNYAGGTISDQNVSLQLSGDESAI